MRRPVKLLVALALVLLAGLSLSRWRPTSRPGSVDSSPAGTLRQRLTAPRPLLPQKRVVPPACRELWERVLALDLEARGITLPVEPACGEWPAEIGGYHKEALARCQSKDNDTDCRMALALLRASLSEFLTEGIPTEQLTDFRALLDRLLIAPSRVPTIEPGEQRDIQAPILRRLLELEPNHGKLAKYYLQIEVLGFIDRRGAGPAPDWRELSKISERARSQSPGDPDLAELTFYASTEGLSENLVAKEAVLLAEARPPSGLGYYYMAAIAAEKGKASEAGALLKRAMELEPDSSRFRSAAQAWRERNAIPIRLATAPEAFLDILLGED